MSRSSDREPRSSSSGTRGSNRSGTRRGGDPRPDGDPSAAGGRTILRLTGRIARGELHRKRRSIAGSTRELFAIGLFAVFAAVMTLAATSGAYAVGRGLHGADVGSIRPFARAAVGFAWLAIVGVVGFRTTASIGDLERPSLVLSSAPIRAVAYGVALAEALTVGCWALPPILLAGFAFAAGAGSAFGAVTIGAVTVLCWLTGVATGFVVGLAVRHLITRYEPIVRLKTPLAIVVAVAYVGVFVTGRFDTVYALLYEPVQAWPVSWLGDLVLVGSGAAGSTRTGGPPVLPVEGASMATTGAVGLGFTALVLAVTLGLTPRVAAAHWLSDPPRPTGRGAAGARPATTGARGDSNAGGRTRATARPRAERLIAPVADRPTLAVAVAVWRRTWRAPSRLLYLLYPLFFLIAPAQSTFESLRATGTVPDTTPVVALAYAGWAGGMAVTLNPLGDQGSTLPTTITTPGSAGAQVRGRILVGTGLTLPPALVLVGLLGALSELSAASVVALLAGTAVAVVGAATLSTGIGAAFPRFGTVSVTRNRSVVVPSKTAAALYSLAAFLLITCLALVAYEPAGEPLAAVLSALLSLFGPVPVDLSVTAARVVGAIVLAGLAVGPLLSYRYAVRRLDRYRLE